MIHFSVTESSAIGCYEGEAWKFSILQKTFGELSRDIFEWDKYMAETWSETVMDGATVMKRKLRQDSVLLFYFFHYLYVS